MTDQTPRKGELARHHTDDDANGIRPFGAPHDHA